VKLKDAEARARESGNSDARVSGYIDLAGAAIASARGDLSIAIQLSTKCAATLQMSDLIAASICFQIMGDTYADMDNSNEAGLKYQKSIELAKTAKNEERAGHVELAFAQLLGDKTIDDIEAMKEAAHDNRATACEVDALVLANRMKLAKDGDRQGALVVLRGINLEKLESYRLRTILNLARGEVVLDEGIDENTTGLQLIEKTLKDAEGDEYSDLALEARLARVKVMLTINSDGAEEAREELVKQATSKGYKRIARLAENYLK
jgi:hypothetical protein